LTSLVQVDVVPLLVCLLSYLILIYLFIYYTAYTHVKSFTIVKNRKCTYTYEYLYSAVNDWRTKLTNGEGR